MSRPRVYRTPEEIRERNNKYARDYQRKHRKENYTAPHGGAHAQANVPPPPEVAADAERRNAASHSSLVAQISGDPKPGQSALDRLKQ
jgi:hypothetical protein